MLTAILASAFYASGIPKAVMADHMPAQGARHVSEICGRFMISHTAWLALRLPSSTCATAVSTGSATRWRLPRPTTTPAVETPSATCGRGAHAVHKWATDSLSHGVSGISPGTRYGDDTAATEQLWTTLPVGYLEPYSGSNQHAADVRCSLLRRTRSPQVG